MSRRALAGLGAALAAGGCRGNFSALAPAAEQASHINWVFWFFTLVCAAVYVATIAALVYALRRFRGNDASREPVTERLMGWWVAGGIGTSIVLLFALLVASIGTGRALAHRPTDQPLTIKVTAQQWWWDVEYQSPQPSEQFRTANEIHLPVGVPVRIVLASRDVIHSFWVPSLHGKKDAIPGHESDVWITATRTGTFRGQCGEFCGHQHASMSLLVHVQPRDRFEAWAAAQRASARESAGDDQRRGQEVFLRAQCVMCHTVRGTSAGSRFGPDLTHVGARQTLAAATLPLTDETLRRWIVDPQGVKPGNRMPPARLPEQDIDALVAYLRSLQ